MMEDLYVWLQQSEGPLGYLVLALASAIEYVVPPLPGDTIALFGIVLASGAGYELWGVYAALNIGATGGGMIAYAVGRWIAVHRKNRTPRFLRTQAARRAIDLAVARFERHGAVYLALNRFVPALRAFFFLAAGMARLPAWKVALFGALSAAVWNALLLALGVLVGANLAELERWVSTYSYIVIGVVVVAIPFLVWRSRRRARTDEASGGEPASEDGGSD
jgi:membrane protein DedA with SNARE-associated domain